MIEVKGIGFPVRRLAFTEASVSLIDQFIEIKNGLESCTTSIRVNPAFFSKTKKYDGFIADFYKCLNDMGLIVFTQGIKNEFKNNSIIDMMVYAKSMALLPFDKLKKLSKIHFEMEESNFGSKEGFSTNYKPLAKYFNNNSAAKEDSAVAGRFIMLFCSMSKKIMDLKKLLDDYENSTIGFIQKIISRSNDCLQNTKKLHLLDDSRRIVDYLINELLFKKLEIIELVNFRKRLSFARETMLSFYIKNAKRISEIRSCNFKRITSRLEIFTSSLKMGAVTYLENKTEFEKERIVFKNYTLSMLVIYDKLTDRMRDKINKDEYISPYLNVIITNIAIQLKECIDNTEISDRESRALLKKSLIRVENTNKLYRTKIRAYEKELAPVSGLIKNQLQYFGKEICEVLLRGNEKEKKSFSRIFFHVYQKNLNLKHNQKQKDTIQKYFEGLLETTGILLRA